MEFIDIINVINRITSKFSVFKSSLYYVLIDYIPKTKGHDIINNLLTLNRSKRHKRINQATYTIYNISSPVDKTFIKRNSTHNFSLENRSKMKLNSDMYDIL